LQSSHGIPGSRQMHAFGGRLLLIDDTPGDGDAKYVLA
jgi:hypothetical protein